MEYFISSGIIDSYFNKLKKILKVDVAIAGGGPSGLLAAYYLAKKNYHVALFERKLAPGGGMWGGAMMFNEIVIQQEATNIADELGISYSPYTEGLYVMDSIQATSSLIYHASKAGAILMNCISIEDVVVQNNSVCGIVINWAPVHRERMHVDPLIVLSKAVLDATGHDCEVTRILERKNGIRLNTSTGNFIGERSLNASEAERTTIENTKEIYPGLYVSGMAANGVNGSYRMGPIFGGMLLSGKKIAQVISERINQPDYYENR